MAAADKAQEEPFRTINTNCNLLRLTLVGYDVGDGTRVNARVLD